MNRNKRLAMGGVAACLLAFFLVCPIAASNGIFTLSGRISGVSGKHAVYVALWQADGFLKTPVKQIRIEPGAQEMFQFQVPAGRWALSAFEDKNGNGVLNMGVFGPREPSGFWHSFSGWHKPRFDEVAVSVSADVTDANITLK